MKFVFYYVISLCKNDYTYIMSRHPSNKKVTYEKISGWWSTKTLNETLKILNSRIIMRSIKYFATSLVWALEGHRENLEKCALM